MSVTYEVVRTVARFQALRQPWHDLWLRSNGGIFQSHAWIAACVADSRLNIGLAWQGDQLLAILPVTIRYRAGIRVLEWAGQQFCDYCDGIVEPRHDALLHYLWHHVYHAGGFDLVWLKQISMDASLYPLIQRNDPGVTAIAKNDICLQVANQWSSGETWFRTLNKKTRNDHLRGKRILSEHGELSFREFTSDDSLGGLLEWATELKLQWLKSHGNISPMFEKGTSSLPSLVAALSEIGVLKVFLLECGTTPLAISINAVQNNMMLAFFATYDPTYERGSPGIVLMTHYTMWAFDRGIKVVDYLRGEEAYKFKFANALIETKTLIGARTVCGGLALAAYRLKTEQTRKIQARPRLGSAYLTTTGQPRAIA